MNMLKNLIFGGKKEEKTSLPAQIVPFKVFGSLFRREDKSSRLLMEDALIRFADGEEQFDFVIHCSKDEENFYFPISTKIDLREQSTQDGDRVIRKYVFDIEAKLKMRLEFDVTNEKDLKEVLLFEKYISQLICINSLKRDLRDEDNDRVNSACRHVVGRDTGRESDTTSQKDSDVFSIMSTKSQTESSSSDMNRLTKELGGLQIDGTKRNINFKLPERTHYPDLKEMLALKEKQRKEADEARIALKKFREDIIIENQNNARLQNAMRAILDMKDIKVAQIGCMFEAIGNTMVLKYQGIIFTIKVLEGYEFKVLIFNEDQQVIHQHSFEQGSTWEANSSDNNLRWIEEKSGHSILYQVSFDVPASSSNVFQILQQCHFEKVNQISLAKVFKAEEIQSQARYVASSFDAEEYEKENKEYFPVENYVDMSFNPACYSAEGEAKTVSNLRTISQARTLDRTFLSKGENIEVYRTDVNDDQSSMQYLLSFPIVKGIDGSVFEPKKMLLQEQDTKMLLLNNEEFNKVFYFDIEKGKVVQEFGADEYLANSIRDICNESKLSALDNSQTFYSINSKNIFLMDPRVAKGNTTANATTGKKEYAVNNKFTCISSTINGEFATGSADGTVRLYNEISKNAKNSFNLGYGDRILGLDISKDSKWILATCQTYLILFPTYDTTNGAKNAFSATVKITDRPNPIRIQLSAEHQYSLNLKEIGFSPAKFDATLNKKEKHIVTSTGVYTVVWDFAKVIQGKKNCYEIKKSEEDIISTEFKFNQPENVLAASSSRLQMQSIVKRYQ